jgi:cell division transport system permease protein
VKKLYSVRNVAGAAGLVLGAAFAAVAVIIIGSTIRMTVLARQREISIMRLVGATDGFVRRPFLIDGLLKGVVGGLLALLLAWGAHSLINQYLIQTTFFDRQMALIGIAFGGLIGFAGSAVSVGRHLRKV